MNALSNEWKEKRQSIICGRKLFETWNRAEKYVEWSEIWKNHRNYLLERKNFEIFTLLSWQTEAETSNCAFEVSFLKPWETMMNSLRAWIKLSRTRCKLLDRPRCIFLCEVFWKQRERKSLWMNLCGSKTIQHLFSLKWMHNLVNIMNEVHSWCVCIRLKENGEQKQILEPPIVLFDCTQCTTVNFGQRCKMIST